MLNIKDDVLNTLKFGDAQKFGQLSIYPIFADSDPRLSYKTFSQVCNGDGVHISEIDSGGSVGELEIVNQSEHNILLVDGEELVGAKQNRALNASMIILPNTKTRIPVSCTEQGRWRYLSINFGDSEWFMPSRTRINKKRSVDESLKMNRAYRSNQRQVWDDISQFSDDADVKPPTDAMRDVYQGREKDLEAFSETFKYVPGQIGMAVLIGRQVAGLEFFSQSSAMEAMLPKLVKSYAVDVMLDREAETETDQMDIAEFLQQISDIKPDEYESTGDGWDYRFENKRITGSALICDDEVIHAAFYNTTLGKLG